MIKIKTTKNLMIIGAIVLLTGAGGSFYFLKHKKPNVNSPSGDGINYSPPTAQEKKDAEDNKKTIDQREAQAGQSQSSNFKQVTPLITSYGQADNYIKVSARVPGVLESSGTCTLSLSKDGIKITQDKTATSNVSEMSCGFISIPRSKLSAGSWSATISYSSARASGTSASTQIEVK